MRQLIIIMAFIPGFIAANAQKNILRSTWEVEIDPIAYILNGYSAHIIYQKNHLRYDLGFFGIKQPEAFHGNKGYTVTSLGVGVKTTYLINGIPGFFTGLGSGLAFHKAQNSTSLEKADGISAGLGVILGYRVFFRNVKSPNLKGLYFSPWVSFDYNYSFRKIAFTDYDFKNKTFSIFPTIHIGYRF